MIFPDDSLKLASLLNSSGLQEFLAAWIGASRYRILLLEPGPPWPPRTRSSGKDNSGSEAFLPPGAPLARFFAVGEIDSLSAAAVTAPATDRVCNEAREELRQRGADHAFALRLGKTTVGLVLVPGGDHDQPLAERELGCLQLFLKHFNTVLNLLADAESQVLVGQLSSGLAHDLRGWLTPITTCLQLWSSGGQDQPKAEALRPTAVKNVESIQACLEQARYFSRHHRPRFQVIRLSPMLRKSVTLADSLLSAKRLKVVVRVADALEAEVDELLILRLLSNLLTNAIRASPPDATIQIDLQNGAPVQSGSKMLRLRITNVGAMNPTDALTDAAALPGSSDPHLSEDSGWGLGLQICRGITHLHGGDITIASVQEPPSTTVVVDLPQSRRP